MPRGSAAEHLARLRSIARAWGGLLLSRRYRGDFGKLRFRCGAGHEWSARAGKIKQGRWCPRCGRARTAAARHAPAIAKLRELIARRGGTIVSPRYLNSQTKLRFRCDQGHEWDAVPNSLLQGTWCPICAYQRRRLHLPPGLVVGTPAWANVGERILARLRRIARKRGGRLLSRTYLGSWSPHRVRCARGHTWEARPASLDEGVWCPHCKERAQMAQLRAIAERWGGACLSKRYLGGRKPMEWRCAQGHRWRGPAQQILRGIWCPGCRLPPPGNLERMRQLARERGGECLSERYVNAETKLRWQCRAGHEWHAAPQSVVQGFWCRVCDRGQGRSRRRLTIEIMHAMAAERGGACLSDAYQGIYDRLRWRCARGHTWITAANNVRRGGWCPVCAHTARGTLGGMRALAIERGGRCLTKTWNDHRQPLLFECGRGHRFRRPANVVRTGVWCPDCRGRNARGAATARLRVGAGSRAR